MIVTSRIPLGRFRKVAPAAAAFLVLTLATTLSALASERATKWTIDDPALEWGPCPEFMPDGCGLAVLQGNPVEANADVLFRLPGNTTAKRHWHSSAERTVLLSGEMHVDVDGQDPVVMTPGSYAYLPGKLPHAASCRSAEPCVLFIAFVDPVDAIEGGVEEVPRYGG